MSGSTSRSGSFHGEMSSEAKLTTTTPGAAETDLLASMPHLAEQEKGEAGVNGRGPPGTRPGGAAVGGPPTGNKPRDGPPPHVLARIGMKALARNGSLLLFIIWCTGLWIFGSSNGSQDRVHNLRVLVRDLDGSVFGASLIEAIASVNGADNLPTFVVSTDATEQDMYDKVYDGTYWASIVANEGATAAFNTSLTSTDSATAYNASSAYTYYVASARYYTSYLSYVSPGLVKVLGMAEETVAEYAVSSSLGLSSLDATQIAIVANAAQSTLVDVAPLGFQSRVFLNTFSIVISHLSQFFFNMMLSGIFTGVGIYRNTTFQRIIKRKYPIKLVWTLLTSLSITSFAIIYAQGYHIEAKNFFALWAAEWVYAWINFNTVAAVIVFLPVAFMSMFVFPWIVTSVAACLIPIELSNIVYRVCYVWPSHAYWNTAITIYGQGIDNRLYIYLPILAAWLVTTEIAWLFGDMTLAKRSIRASATPGSPPGGAR